MRSRFEEVLATVPASRVVDLGQGRLRTYVFTEDERISVARELIIREQEDQRAHAGALAEHLAALVDLSIDDAGARHLDPIVEVDSSARPDSFLLTTRSCRRFRITVEELAHGQA